MTPEERSKQLLKEANDLIALLHLHDICASVGQLTPTGSYFMDLMMYPDIDFYLTETTSERVLGIGAELSKCEIVQKIVYERGTDDLSGGFYLSPVIKSGSWGRSWKIDIWSLPGNLVAKRKLELTDLKNRMTPKQRDLILATKFKLLNKEGRTPMFSGIFICRAIIDMGIQEFDGIVSFLRENGIKV